MDGRWPMVPGSTVLCLEEPSTNSRSAALLRCSVAPSASSHRFDSSTSNNTAPFFLLELDAAFCILQVLGGGGLWRRRVVVLICKSPLEFPPSAAIVRLLEPFSHMQACFAIHQLSGVDPMRTRRTREPKTATAAIVAPSHGQSRSEPSTPYCCITPCTPFRFTHLNLTTPGDLQTSFTTRHHRSHSPAVPLRGSALLVSSRESAARDAPSNTMVSGFLVVGQGARNTTDGRPASDDRPPWA